MSASFNRTVSRDLFDAHYLITKLDLDRKKLRAAFVVYLAMTKSDLESLTPFDYGIQKKARPKYIKLTYMSI